MVLEHAAIHAAGDRRQLAHLTGRRHPPPRRRRRPLLMTVDRDGRRLSIQVRVRIGDSPTT